MDFASPSLALCSEQHGTGIPEIGGITTLEAQWLLRGLRGLNVVGGDVVEVAPPYDQTGNAALVRATPRREAFADGAAHSACLSLDCRLSTYSVEKLLNGADFSRS